MPNSWKKALYLIEILHQTTTAPPTLILPIGLYLIEILHQTTTYFREIPPSQGCILSKFYIKPQLRRQRPNFCCVVSYRNSTSNHNKLDTPLSITEVVSYRNSTSNHNEFFDNTIVLMLYLIEILHQTTT